MKSIVVDNFFDDPYEVINLAKGQTYYHRGVDQFYEGLRTPDLKTIDINFFNKVVSKILYEYFPTHNDYKVEGHLNFHKTNENDLNDPNWIHDRVHRDNYLTSSIIYLTPNAPMTSGTQLYREVNGTPVADVVYHNQFNRMIMFPGEIPHSAMDFKGGKEDRLTLLFFLESIEIF